MTLESCNSENSIVPTDISTPPPSISLPPKLFEVLNKPPVKDIDTDIDTCCNCKKINPRLEKITEIKNRISEYTEFIDFVKNQIQVFPLDDSQIIAPVAVNQSIVTVVNNGVTSLCLSDSSDSSEDFTKSILREAEGDMFTIDNEYALAHYTSEDFRMDRGIGVQFKNKYKRICDLLDQKKTVGEVAFIKANQRYVFYLITKKLDCHKSTLKSISDSLTSLRQFLQELNIKKLAVPHIDNTLEKLKWEDIKKLFLERFQDTDIKIVVYNHKEISCKMNGISNEEIEKKSLKIIEISDHLTHFDLEDKTAVILFGSKDGLMSNIIQNLDKKYRFAENYKDDCKAVQIGDILSYSYKFGFICIFIVKKSFSGQISFKHLETCISKFNKKEIKILPVKNIAIEWDHDNNDPLFNDKIITVFQNKLNPYLQLYVCNKLCEIKSRSQRIFKK